MSGNNNNKNSIKLSCLDRVKRNTDGKRPKINSIKFVVWAADKSGSMYSLMSSLRKGYKNFIEEQQEQYQENSESEVRLTTITFNSKVEVIGEVGQHINKVSPNILDNVESGGQTSLYDAIGKGIEILKDLENKNKDKYPNATYQLVTFTDGEENSSTYWNHLNIQKEIKLAEKRGWKFIYLGANQDAIKRGTKMGFSSQRCATVEASPMGMQTMCRLTSHQISTGSAGFTQEEQRKMSNTQELYQSSYHYYDSESDDDDSLSMPPRPIKLNRCNNNMQRMSALPPPIIEDSMYSMAISQEKMYNMGRVSTATFGTPPIIRRTGGIGGGGGKRRRRSRRIQNKTVKFVDIETDSDEDENMKRQ